MFESMDALVAAKLDLPRRCAPGTPLALNAACPFSMRAFAELAARHPIVGFSGGGEPAGQLEPAIRVEGGEGLPGGGLSFDLALPGRTLRGLRMDLFGVHQLANVAAAAALLFAGGFDPAWVADALPDFRTEPLRGQIVRTGGITYILDCYNASPVAMAGALATLAEFFAEGRRVLVLADMLELGAQSEDSHQALLPILAQCAPAVFFGLGSQMTALAGVLAGEGWDARGFDDRDTMAEALASALAPGDVVLFKGSRAFGLECVAQALAPDLRPEAGGGRPEA
jgi:UDP-N-acetylmuramoyl-tripeptide--D-alanyl-D-alanine ligase